MTLSEALVAVSRMIAGYTIKVQDSYLGAIAETLMHCPKSSRWRVLIRSAV
jgi:hypothetical protein